MMVGNFGSQERQTQKFTANICKFSQKIPSTRQYQANNLSMAKNSHKKNIYIFLLSSREIRFYLKRDHWRPTRSIEKEWKLCKLLFIWGEFRETRKTTYLGNKSRENRVKVLLGIFAPCADHVTTARDDRLSSTLDSHLHLSHYETKSLTRKLRRTTVGN